MSIRTAAYACTYELSLTDPPRSGGMTLAGPFKARIKARPRDPVASATTDLFQPSLTRRAESEPEHEQQGIAACDHDCACTAIFLHTMPGVQSAVLWRAELVVSGLWQAGGLGKNRIARIYNPVTNHEPRTTNH